MKVPVYALRAGDVFIADGVKRTVSYILPADNSLGEINAKRKRYEIVCGDETLYFYPCRLVEVSSRHR